MSSTQRTRLTAAVAAVGAGALAFGGAAVPASAEPSDQPTPIQQILPEPVTSGAEVLDAISGDQLKTVAERVGLEVNEVKSLLEQDLAGVIPGGYFFFKDKWGKLPDVAPAETTSNIPGDPTGGSRPSAPVTIYLDFDGEAVEGTGWNAQVGGPIEAAPASAADEAYQREVWELVAEDYLPFNVNVTIADPGEEKLQKADSEDSEYGSHVVITDTYDETLPFAAETGGIAFYNAIGSHYLSPAWVFTTGVSGTDNPADAPPKAVADAASHEVGHNFGLNHDNFDSNGNGTVKDANDEFESGEEYYSPAGGLWGPIMGAPYSSPFTQWSTADYTTASKANHEDDLALITDRSAARGIFVLFDESGAEYDGEFVCSSGDPNNPQPGDEFWEPNSDQTCEPKGAPLTALFEYTDRGDYKKDDHGNDSAGASALNNSDATFGAEGFVGQTADVDVFSLVTNGGPFLAQASPAENGANLDIKLTLTDAQGNVVAENNPEASAASDTQATGLDASIEQALEAGSYYLTVDGVGQGDPTSATVEAANGYSEYGSLGFYTLTGEAAPFDAEPVVITSPEDGAEVAPKDLEVTGTAEPGAAVAVTVNGEAGGEATAADDGSWSTTLAKVPYGASTIEAQETVGTVVVPEKASVSVTVPVDAPTITKPEDGQKANTARPSFAGEGIAGATVNLSIEAKAPEGAAAAETAAVAGSATVNDDGAWEFVPEADLANGEYSVVATQTINEVTSGESNVVNFTIDVSSGDAGGNEDGGDDDGGPDLPDTGSSSAGLIGLAAGLVLLGGGAAWYARSRRSTV